MNNALFPFGFTALILGFVGSLHCAGMCGPIALALPGGAGLRFVIGRLAYNTGRIITYCVLGALFGVVGKSVVLAGFQRSLSITLGLTLLFGFFATKSRPLLRPLNFLLTGLRSRMSGLLRQRSLVSQAALGSLNGLLPCGLVYVACAGASTTGSVGQAIVYMGAFGLGTLPMMLGVGLSGRLIPLSFRLRMNKLVPISVVLLSGLLLLRGLSLGIPFLSPNLSDASCCAH